MGLHCGHNNVGFAGLQDVGCLSSCRLGPFTRGPPDSTTDSRLCSVARPPNSADPAAHARAQRRVNRNRVIKEATKKDVIMMLPARIPPARPSGRESGGTLPRPNIREA
jgi:hypothetical protein